MISEDKTKSKDVSSWSYYKDLSYKVYNGDNLSNDAVRFGCLISLLSTKLLKNGLKNTGLGNSFLVINTLNIASTQLAGFGYDYVYPQDKEEVRDTFSKKCIQATTANALYSGATRLAVTLESNYSPGNRLAIFSTLWLTSMPFSVYAIKKTSEYIDIAVNGHVDSGKNIYSTDILSNAGTRFGYVAAGLTVHSVMTIAHQKHYTANFAILGTPILTTIAFYLGGGAYDYLYPKSQEERQDSFDAKALQSIVSSALFIGCGILANILADKYFPQKIRIPIPGSRVVKEIVQHQNKYAALKIFPALWLTSTASTYFALEKAEEYGFIKLEEFEYCTNLAYNATKLVYKMYDKDNLSNNGLVFGRFIAGFSTYFVKSKLKTITRLPTSKIQFNIVINLADTTAVYLAGVTFDFILPKYANKKELEASFYEESMQFLMSSLLHPRFCTLANWLAPKYLPDDVNGEVKVFSYLWLMATPLALFAISNFDEFFLQNTNNVAVNATNNHLTDNGIIVFNSFAAIAVTLQLSSFTGASVFYDMPIPVTIVGVFSTGIASYLVARVFDNFYDQNQQSSSSIDINIKGGVMSSLYICSLALAYCVSGSEYLQPMRKFYSEDSSFTRKLTEVEITSKITLNIGSFIFVASMTPTFLAITKIEEYYSAKQNKPEATSLYSLEVTNKDETNKISLHLIMSALDFDFDVIQLFPSKEYSDDYKPLLYVISENKVEDFDMLFLGSNNNNNGNGEEL